MKTKAVRLYGKQDLRFEEMELRGIGPDEILAKVITDSLCMSSYKAMLQGSDHRCVPDGLEQNPIIIGHELSGAIMEVGANLRDRYAVGERFTVQPKMYFGDRITGPGYSYTEYGGDATHIIIPAEVIEGGYILKYAGDSYYKASTAEPISCLISGLDALYHLDADNKRHVMGVKNGGNMAILAGAGPMGLGAAELAMVMEHKPRLLVITDIDQNRLDRAQRMVRPRNGVELLFVNTAGLENEADYLLSLTGNRGFDDIMVMAPVPAVIQCADKIAGTNSCVNFFAGPTRQDFYANINFYDIHYKYKHFIGTSGGDVGDMRAALSFIEGGLINPSVLITHVGGLNSAAGATLNLPKIPGGKKLIYCNIEMELTAIEEFEEKGKNDPFFRALHEICGRHSMLWNKEAEEYLLQHGKSIL